MLFERKIEQITPNLFFVVLCSNFFNVIQQSTNNYKQIKYFVFTTANCTVI